MRSRDAIFFEDWEPAGISAENSPSEKVRSPPRPAPALFEDGRSQTAAPARWGWAASRWEMGNVRERERELDCRLQAASC
jgi:hypothetical protein